LPGSRQRLDQLASQAVLGKSGRRGNDGLHFLFQSRLIPAGKDEFAGEISRPPGGFTQRHAETDKIFRVHDLPQPSTAYREPTENLL
jgi:hypothetical protein